MRCLGKDRTDLYAGGVLQQNVMNDIHGSQKKRKVGNSSYPEWMLDKVHQPLRKETRIGEVVTMKQSSIKLKAEIALKLLSTGIPLLNKVALDFVSIGSAFGNIFTTEINNLTLPQDHTYQTYCLTDIFFQGYYSLALNTSSEVWFTSFKDAANQSDVTKLCSLLVTKLFHLFEESLMDRTITQGSFQLKISSYIQQNGVSKMVSGCVSRLNEHKNCLLILFLFLSKKLIDEWLPSIIKTRKASLNRNANVAVHSNKSLTINPFIGGEVNRLVGWALYARINKYRNIAKKQEGYKLNVTNDLLNILEDIKAIESDIIQNPEYIRRYYFTDDTIRNKGSLTLIAPSYIVPF